MVNENFNEELKENIIGFPDGEDWIYCELQSRRYINKIKKYKEIYPKDVEIISESTDGGLSVKLKINTFSFKLPSPKKNVSEEFKRNASDRFKKMWENKNNE